jgi:integrase
VTGTVFKRCSCPPVLDGAGRRRNCSKRHGSWFFAHDVPDVSGKRRQIRRGGFASAADTRAALEDSLLATGHGVRVQEQRRLTVAAYLEAWLERKKDIGRFRPSTALHTNQHLRDYWIPLLGHYRLGDLTVDDVDRALASIRRQPTRKKRLSPSSVLRIHATLRSALNDAVRRRMIPYNPAALAELEPSRRPKVRPWEPEELGAFLDFTATHRLGVLFEVLAMTGLRRGEIVGLRWGDVDLERRVLWVRQAVVQVGYESVVGPPKTTSGEERRVDLDAATAGSLIAHRLRQDDERAAFGAAHEDHDLVFAREDGSCLKPEVVSKTFRKLVAGAGLRRVRLHDLRHGQASIMLAAGVDMTVVSKRVGHSGIRITSDTYAHLLEGVGRQAAEAAAALVPRGTPLRARLDQG